MTAAYRSANGKQDLHKILNLAKIVIFFA